MSISTFSSIRSVVLALALVAVSGCQTTIPMSWQLPEGVKTIPVNGYPMAYTEMGSGSSLVLVHGVLCDYRCMAPAQRGLADAWTVRSVSLRRFFPERWDGTGIDFSLAQHVRDLGAFLEQANAPVDLVAWSYGAHVAYELAKARPELIRRLVLAEAPTDSLVASEGSSANLIRHQRADKTAAMYKSGDTEGGINFAVDAINGPGAWSRAPEASKAVVRDNAWTVVGIGRDDPPSARCEDFAALKMPVLLIIGEKTTPRFKEIVARQALCLPSARVSTIAGSGHPTPLQNTQAFNHAIREFLR